MSFYERFAQLCMQKDVTMSKACTEMGVNPSITWRWKESTPSARTMAKLGEYFGMTMTELMGDAEYVKKERPVSQTGSLFDFLEDDRTRNVMQYLMAATPEQREWLKGLLRAYDGE